MSVLSESNQNLSLWNVKKYFPQFFCPKFFHDMATEEHAMQH